MMLVEEGKIDLDDKITKYIANLPVDWNLITIRHLLTHTSSIVNYASMPEIWERFLYPVSKSEMINLIAGHPLVFQPGENYLYGNNNYFLLAMIVEQASGKSFNDFVTERIFSPLSMKETRFNDYHRLIMNRASGYELTNQLQNVQHRDPSWSLGAGDLISTTLDLAKWDAALYTERLLTRKSLAQMWQPMVLNDGSSIPYGFGWGTGMLNNHRIVWHAGGTEGFRSFIARFIEDRVTVIVLINEIPAPVEELAINIANFYIDGLLANNTNINKELNLDLDKEELLLR